MLFVFQIVTLSNDTARITASAENHIWTKNYPYMEAATREAEELRVITRLEKQRIDRSRRMPGGFNGYEGQVEIDHKTLAERGFLGT